MKNCFAFILLSLLISCGPKSTVFVPNDLAKSIPIATSIDLTLVEDDKVPVVVNPGRFVVDSIIYRMPRAVQGSYDIEDFGNYIEGLKAIDYEGNELKVIKIDLNSWSISDAKNLDKITYLVNDTFDIETTSNFQRVFSPSGTNISPDNYVLNLHGFIGYFESLKDSQYTLDVTAPANFVRSTALQNTGLKSSADGTKITSSYFASRYFDITDNPMMYGELDVEEFMVGNVKIVLSVYSPNNVHSAISLKETVYKMMEAQKSYLGTINSTSRYDIYLYLSDGSAGSPTGFGALEHHTSTVVVLQERASKERLAKSMTDIVAHEFFHILTPLTVHSEDVHYFDYNDPTFSKHLWMYEGVTEYFAQHFQVYQDLIEPEDYYRVINRQIVSSMRYDDAMSFTEMSENILDAPYSDNYLNVYQKGALIGMCIDILMREETKGTRSLLSLMKELSVKYGVNKPFNDDTFIKELAKMTYPTVSLFLENNVEGDLPINYDKILEKVGLKFEKEQVETNYVLSSEGFILDRDEESETLFFSSGVKRNSFWIEQGVLKNDIVKEINGSKVTMDNFRMQIGRMFRWETGQDIEMKLDRNGEEVIIKAKLTPAFTFTKMLTESTEASESQIKTRNAWLKG
ncbi:peptidase M61 [Flavobacteriales bacterium 34_180_T64]|mgnify:CR=1 FL=1|nr:peptidase M61 [Flavobacteriales bacterium 34_180_T64]